MKAVKKIQRTGNSRLMVVEEDRLIGIITLKDIIQALSVRSDLDDN
jgi:CBS domain-containing protein